MMTRLARALPSKPNTKSVRFRTTTAAVLALLVLLTFSGFTIAWLVGRNVQQSFDNALLEQARDRALLYDGGTPVGSLTSVLGDEAIVVVVGPDGQVLAATGTPTPEDVQNLAPGVHTQEVTIIEAGEGLEREAMQVAVALAQDGSAFIVGNEGDVARDTNNAVRTVLLIVVPLVAAAGALLLWLITGRALEPVRAMRDDLDDVVHASDGRRVRRPDSGDEIDELGATINDVLDRLASQSQARRQFVADASHELKSPLANARAVIDTAERDPDPAEHQRVVTAVGAELQRLHALVDDLLYLAREDETVAAKPAVIDLADLAFNEAERVAAASSKTIDASAVQPAAVFADPTEVSRAIRNLVENAERFAQERVSLAITDNGDQPTLVVADDGPGIPQADRARVFERFTRVDADRARSAGGTGLGLSIVASIAKRNHGTISVSESPAGGAQFTLTFPPA